MLMEIKPLVLIVEDEKPICHFMTTILTANGYRVVSTGKGLELPSLVSSYCPDLIILDLGLPDIDGSEVLSTLRTWSTIPVIVVSARDSERDKVQALDTGADDYITKPFSNAELLARIRTAMRHSKMNQDGELSGGVYTVGGLCVDSVRMVITVDSAEIHFTQTEYKIIELLARNRGRVLTYDMILKAVWGPYFTDNQTLRVNMANIRRKIEKKPAEPRYIKTEIGVGYRMAEE